jgi:hypothetical protein
MSGSFTDKARKLGFILRSAEKLVHTRLVEGADNIFEMLTTGQCLEGHDN